MYLITVYFDEKTSKQLERYIKSIAEVSGNDFMTKNNVPPHMTISSIEARSAGVLKDRFEHLCDNLSAGNIQIVSVGQLFPYVMYATPVLNSYLQELAEKVYESVSDIPETSVNKCYQPGSWLPHITLGKTLTKIQMQNAFLKMQSSFSPLKAQVTAISLASTNPNKDIIKKRLKLLS